MLPSDASSSCRTTEEDRIREAEDDDAEEPIPRVMDRDPTGRFVRYADPLGKGAYKSVWRAFDEDEGVEVAWNQLRVDHLTELDAGKLRSEVLLLSALRHPNIIRLHHAWAAQAANGGETVYFVTELMTSGTLKRYLRKTTGGIRPKFLKHICRQVLSGLAYLHTCEPPVIHRDLKCENIFVNGNTGEVKLGDLGLATVKPMRHVTSVIGTPEFMAPELYDERYDEKVDVYAFGMCVLEMVTKEYPYSECSNQAQIYKKVTNCIKPAALDKIETGPLRDLIEVCLRYDPEERPAAAELLQHPFLVVEAAPTDGGGSSASTHAFGTPQEAVGAMVSPDLRRGSVDAGSFLLGGDAMRAPSLTGSVSALSTSLLSTGVAAAAIVASSPITKSAYQQPMPGPATPVLPTDLQRATSFDANRFGSCASSTVFESAPLLLSSHLAPPMPPNSAMSNVSTASAPAAIRPPVATTGFAAHSATLLSSDILPATAATSIVPPSHGQVDFVKRMEGGTLLLKMISRQPGGAKHKCIKFPFVLDQDTPEDVVAEMVREQVLAEDDRNLAVENVRQAVERGRLATEMAINTMVGSVGSCESGPISSASSAVGMRRSSSGRSHHDEPPAAMTHNFSYPRPDILSPTHAAHYATMPIPMGSMPYPAHAAPARTPSDAGSNDSPLLSNQHLARSLPRQVPLQYHRRAASSSAVSYVLAQESMMYNSMANGHSGAAGKSYSGSKSLTEAGVQALHAHGLRVRTSTVAGDRAPLSPIDASDIYYQTHSCAAPQYSSSMQHGDPGLFGRYHSNTNSGVRRASLQPQPNALSHAALQARHLAAMSMMPDQYSTEPTGNQCRSFGSSPHSEHGELTAASTAATGDTSLVSPVFGSPHIDGSVCDDASSVSATHLAIPGSSVPVFAEVLMARTPSTTGIGVMVGGSTNEAHSEAGAPNKSAPVELPTRSMMSETSHNDHPSPHSSAGATHWDDDGDEVDVDVNDPKLVELWEKQRQEAETMARNHMVEWERLVQDLRDKRLAQRSTLSVKSGADL